MPELKNSFTAGRMNKDLDERIIPSTEYREALNIGVATSESSDVGAAQNILGNVKLSCAIQGPNGKYLESSKHIAAIADPLTDNIYRFVNTSGSLPAHDPSHVWMDRIIEFDTKVPLAIPCSDVENGRVVANKEQAVLIDIWKVKTNATGSSAECDGADTTVDVNKNIFQIRHGMLVYTDSGSIDTGDGISDYDEVYIKSVDIVTNTTAKITLNKALGFVVTGGITLEADRVLNFSTNRYITGVNVLDGMIFWTDNYSEPKKINIERSRAGCVVSRTNPALNYGLQNFDQHTRLVVNEMNPEICTKESPGICDDVEIVNDGKTFGCMDRTAFNFDPLATSNTINNYSNILVDCCYIEGCMDPLYVEFDPLACQDNPSMCLTLVDQPANICDNLTTEGVYALSITNHQYPGSSVSRAQTDSTLGIGSDFSIWNKDLRLAKFEMLVGQMTATSGVGGFRHGVKYVAVGKTNGYGGRVCRADYTLNTATPISYLFTPDYATNFVVPGPNGETFSGLYPSSPGGYEDTVTFHCYQDLLTWMLSLTPATEFNTTATYLDPNNNFASVAVQPPFASAFNAVSAQSTPPGIFDLTKVRNFVQSEVLFVYTDSQLC